MMDGMALTIAHKHLWKHETKREVLWKFLLVLALFTAYAVFVSLKFGVEDGLLVAWLSWSFFVFCTPIADAGLLVDLPLRLITGIRMLYAEMMVWVVAAALNVAAFVWYPEIYQRTDLLSLFEFVIRHPFPYAAIILISAVGTFASVLFGDELLDVVSHKERTVYGKHRLKYRLIVLLFCFAIAFVLYDFLLRDLGVRIELGL